MNIQLGFIALGGILSVVLYQCFANIAASLRRRHELRQRISQEARINRWRGF
jgi:hypothetical protein